MIKSALHKIFINAIVQLQEGVGGVFIFLYSVRNIFSKYFNCFKIFNGSVIAASQVLTYA